MRGPRVLACLLAFVLGLGVAGLTACGGGSSRALIPSADAGPLKDDFDAVASAVGSGDCAGAARALAQAQNDLDQLPQSVSVRLRRRLQQGIDRLRGQAPTECRANQTQTVTQPTVTATTTTTTTPTTTTATTPTTTTTTTPTTTTPTTTTPTTTSGGSSGGVTVP